MRPLVITINGEYGFLFEGEHPRTYAMVPQNCVTLCNDGSFLIDTMAYIKGGWATRNMRFNAVDLSGTKLFPNHRKPVTKSDALGLGVFLDHLRRGYGSRFAGLSAMNASG